MGQHDMALVAVYSKSEMFRMGKLTLGIKGKFFVGMTPEARERGILERRKHWRFLLFDDRLFDWLPSATGK